MADLNEYKLQHYRDRVAAYEETIATLRAQYSILELQLAECQSSDNEPEVPRRPRATG